MALTLNDFVLRLESWGLSDVILPFVLIYVVIFVSLSKVRMFSFGHDAASGNRKISSMVALVISAMVVIPHVTGQYPPGADVVEIINQSIPQVALLLVAGVAIFMVFGLFFHTPQLDEMNLGLVLGGLGLLLVVAIFGSAANLWQIPEALRFLEHPDNQAAIIIITVFALVIWFITRGDRSSGQAQSGANFLNWMFSRHGGHGRPPEH